MRVAVSLGVFTLTMACGLPVVAGDALRHTGRLVSLSPAEGVVFIEEVRPGGDSALIEIEVREAKVVRLWRDPAKPWRWRERPTRVHRWPVGTFVVVIGRAGPDGVVDARRIEIPKGSLE